MGVALLFGCIGVAVISWFFFFGGPIVFSIVAVILAGVLVVQLARATATSATADRRQITTAVSSR